MKSQNRKLSFPIVEADPLHHSGFLSESECGNEMREGELRTRTRVITDKTFHSLIVCLCYYNKIGFKTSQQCQKSVGFNVRFLICADCYQRAEPRLREPRQIVKQDVEFLPRQVQRYQLL